MIGSNESGVNILNENSVKYLNAENSDLLNDSIRDITGLKDNMMCTALTKDFISVLTKNDKKRLRLHYNKLYRRKRSTFK